MAIGDPRPDDAYVWDDSLGWVMKRPLLDYAAPGHLPKMDSEGRLLYAPWQPIETAPKDGTAILLGWVNSGVSEGLWRDGMANHWKLPGFYFTDDDPLTAKPCQPTHWMPLPAPPAA